MFTRVLSLFGPPVPAGPPALLRSFTAADRPIDAASLSLDDGAWRVDAAHARTVRLFEIVEPGVERCLLAYRAMLRAEALAGRAYLEMWCRFPGRGEFFSRGLQQAIDGTSGWASYDTPFYLKRGQRPDRLKLNLVLEAAGLVWIKDLEVVRTPLAR